jgi:hypothetical protein
MKMKMQFFALAGKCGVAGHLRTELVVAVEADAAGVRIAGLRGGFGDVMQQHAHDQRQRGLGGQQAEHETGVNEDIPLGMELRRLLAALQRENFRQELRHEAAVHQQVETAHAVRAEHGLDELLADALDAHALDLLGQAADRLPRGMLDVETEHRGETHGPQHAQMVFFETIFCHADRAQQAHAQIDLTRRRGR